MPKGKRKGKTRRTKSPTKRVLQDFRGFKAGLKRLIDKTQLAWIGPPYETGSRYHFVLNDQLIQFVMTAVQNSRGTVEEQAQAATLQMAEAIRIATASDPEEDAGEQSDQEETDTAFEKFLTESEPEGIIDPNGEEDKEEAIEAEGPQGAPEGSSGDDGTEAPLGPILTP